MLSADFVHSQWVISKIVMRQGLACAETCGVVLIIQFSIVADALFPEDTIILPWEMLLPMGVGD